MVDIEKTSRKKQEILNAVMAALDEHDYVNLTIEDVASRAGVGKSTIYRWWGHKSELVFEVFKLQTLSIFDLDYSKSLESNLKIQLLKLSKVLQTKVGRAALIVMTEHREAAGNFFRQYLRPKREEMHKLIQQSISNGEITSDYPFELMLDSLYAPIHYQIIFFNHAPDQDYIDQLVEMILSPVHVQ